LHAAPNHVVGLAPVLAQQRSARGKGQLVIFRRPANPRLLGRSTELSFGRIKVR
jgi:hypothetical protein